LHYHDGLAGTGNTARVITFRGPLTTELLHEALAVLQCRHPLLRAGVTGTTTPAFVERPNAPVPVSRHPRTAVDDWIAVVEGGLPQQFDVRRGPLLRVVWLDGSALGLPDVLIFLTCHIVTDGFSSSTMAAECLEILAALDAGEIPSRASTPMPTCTSELLPDDARGVVGAGRVAQLLVRQAFQTAWARPAPLPSEPAALRDCRTRILPYVLPLAVVERLAEHAKTNGASLHAALLAAKLIAAATLIEARGGPHPTPIALAAVSTTNIRARLRSAALDHELAARVGGIRGVTAVRGDSEFWPLARQVADDVRRGVAGNEDILSTLLAPMFAHVQVHMPSLAAASVQIANLGRSPVREHYGRFTVASVQAALNVCGFGPSLLSHITTTATGTYWNVLYCEPRIRHADARAFATKTMAVVRQMADDG
jgi:hypothetical protein